MINVEGLVLEITSALSLILNPLVYGRSGYQQFFLVVYTAVTCAILGVSGRFRAACPREVNRSIRWAIVTIACVYSLQIVGHVTYSSLSGLPLDVLTVVVTETGLSSSALSHMHASKAALAALLLFFGGHPGSIRGDAGWPFYDLLGPKYSMLMAVLLVFAIAISFVLLCQIKRCGAGASLLIALSISSYLLIKGGIDGGPFTKGLAFHSVFWLTTLLTPPSRWSEMLSSLRLCQVWLLAASISFLLQLSGEYLGVSVFGSWKVSLVLALITNAAPLPYFIIIAAIAECLNRQANLVRGLIGLSLGLLGIASLLFLSKTYISEFLFLNQEIAPGTIVRYFASSRDTVIEEYHVKEPISMRELYAKLGLRPGVRSVKLLRDGKCVSGQELLSFDIRVLEGALDTSSRAPSWLNVNVSKCNPSSWCTHQIRVALEPCTPIENSYHGPAVSILTRFGAKRFVVRNFRYANAEAEDRWEPD